MISEDEARALWRRAAELEARAADCDAERYALMPDAGNESAFTADEIVAAAEGAGIAAEHVRVALVESSLPHTGRRSDWTGLLRVLSRYEADAVERAVLINATPKDVLNSVLELLSRQPYALTLERSFGHDPLGTGVLIFRLSDSMRKKFRFSIGSGFARDVNVADGKYFLVTVRAWDGHATRLSVRMPLLRRGENVAFFAMCAGATGWLASTLASYITPWVSMPSVLSALIPGLVGAVGIVVGTGIYRRIYRWATKKGEAALEHLLQAIAFDARTSGSRNTPEV